MTKAATQHAATLAAVLMSELSAPAVAAALKIRALPQGAGYVGIDVTDAKNAAASAKLSHPETVAADALALIRIGKGVARWAVRACNGEGERYWQDGKRLAWRWDDTHDAAHAKADAKALAKLQAIADRYGATVKLGGDPRGYVVKLHLANGRHNTWGGAESGWGVA